MTRSVEPTRSPFFWPTVIVSRSSQSGSAESPKIERGFVFAGRSRAAAEPICGTTNTPASAPVILRQNCRLPKSCDLDGVTQIGASTAMKNSFAVIRAFVEFRLEAELRAQSYSHDYRVLGVARR